MISINNVRWWLVFVDPNHPMLVNLKGVPTYGSCDLATRTIYISNALPAALMKKVLCHEITHAAMESYQVSLTVDQEELLADLIATYGSEILDITNKIFRKLKLMGAA